MVRSELVQVLCKKLPHIMESDVELSVNCILEQIAQALETGERIEIRNFGAFSVRHRAPRKARNPKTGETVYLPAKSAIHFKPGKAMRDKVNDQRNQYSIKD